MREGCLSAGGQENSIEAVQQGDMYPEDLAAAASVARSMPGMPLDQRLAGLPGAYQAALAAMAEGTMLERSASASSERHAEPQRGQADYSAVSMLATAIGQSLQQARPSSGQDAWTVTGHRNPAQAVQQQASAAQHAPDGFSVPALPTNSPFHSLASRYPAMLDALLRSDHGLTAPAVAQTVRQELAHALLAHLPAPVQQHHSVQAERVASTRAPNGNPGGFDGAVPPNGGSNEPSGMPPAAGSNENRASQQSLTDFMQQRLHTAGSLARPAEGELQDPRLGQHGPALGSPPMEEAHPAEVLQRPAGVPASGQSRQLAGRDAAPQEAHSGAVPHRPPSAERLHGADSGAMPALSIIRGLSGPFPASALPGHANAFQRRAQVRGPFCSSALCLMVFLHQCNALKVLPLHRHCWLHTCVLDKPALHAGCCRKSSSCTSTREHGTWQACSPPAAKQHCAVAGFPQQRTRTAVPAWQPSSTRQPPCARGAHPCRPDAHTTVCTSGGPQHAGTGHLLCKAG